ncbi:MAG: flippase-like domain-containing protein [Labilithrix sp.]|nr:flippase-like domain-containing protein [Labilithrix sp.]MCW5816326.1 flippase-like domain-containing protein [Labilithrix sp.]
MQGFVRKVLIAMLLGVAVYGGFAVYRGLDKMGEALSHFDASAFVLACGLAFANYVIRYFKWEFYLARLDIRGVKKVDSFFTFLSGFVLTVTPGKVGEVFKSLILFETYGVAMTRTAPIVVAERATDVVGIVLLIIFGATVGFSGGLLWAGIGASLVLVLLLVVGNRRLSLAIIGLIGKLPGRFGKMAPKLEAAYESLATMLAPRNLFVPSLLSAVAWMMECLALWVILRGFGQSTSVALSTFFYATSTLIGAIVPVPGGLGVTESALLGQMTELGHVEANTATSAMILVRFATLWFAVVVGFVALTLMKRRFPKLLADDKKTAIEAGVAEAASAAPLDAER